MSIEFGEILRVRGAASGIGAALRRCAAGALAACLCLCAMAAVAQNQAAAMRHLERGFEAAQQGRYDEALASVRAAKKLEPVLEFENFPWHTKERAGRMDEALRLRDRSPDASIGIALELIKLEPDNPLPYNHIGWTYLRVKQDPRNAESVFLTSVKVALLRRDRFFVGSLPALGTLYYDAGKREKASFYYRAALILDPQSTSRRMLEERIAELAR